MTFWLFYPLPLPLALAAAALPLAGGLALDLVLGDPRGFPHPVVYMGRAIRRFENHVVPLFPQSPRGQLAAGALLALALPLGSFLASLGAIALAGHFLGFWASLALETFWCWQALALRDLQAESMAVYAPLCRGDLPAARKAVGRIVGRDTQALDEAGVARAAVETVAENLSDGVIAPLFYLAIGGAPLALWYKAVNTLDSMVGYKTPRYLYLGRFSARQDDAANFLPSRLSALALIAGAFLAGEDGPRAWKIWRRDRFHHSSPNSAQTESACAGALGVRLGGDAFYFGKPVQKPTLGDAREPLAPAHIPRACRLLYFAALPFAGLLLAARLGVLIFLF